MSIRDARLGLGAVAARRRTATGAGDLVAVDRGAGTAAWRPVTISARVAGLDFGDWVAGHLDTVRQLLAERGALRLRGMALSAETFGVAVSAVAGAPLADYVNRSTPRSRVEGRVFTSTEYSADQVIPMHSEQSYATSWPSVLGFWCVRAAAGGGETPLAPTASVLDGLPPELVDRFDEHGVRYERWYRPYLDLPWQEVFQTDEPASVDEICARAGITADWFDDGALRTRQVAQATTVCPTTNRRVWFNQANLFHQAALPPQIAGTVRETVGDRMPRHAYLGNGEPIASEDIRTIESAFASVAWAESWLDGDVVLVDNIAVAHGRRSYQGARTVLVAMAGSGGSGSDRAAAGGEADGGRYE